jgi:hypothetical protein
MSSSTDQWFINQYSDNVHLLVREGQSKLMGIFPTENAKGEKHFFERFDKIETQTATSTNQSLVFQDPTHTRRMATLQKKFNTVAIDEMDDLQRLVDPTNTYAVEQARSLGEDFDRQIYADLLGTAATGKDGAGSQAFDTSNQQIAHGSAGLTVAKLNQALRILENNEVDVDSEPLIMSAGAFGIEDLMGDTSNQFTSFEFQEIKALANRNLPQFRGINILRTQRVPDETADTTYRAILFTPNVLKVAMTRGLKVEMKDQPTLLDVKSITASMVYGAVRMEEKLAVDILYQ